MELGNMIFGNSRGGVRVERGAGMEEELLRLFERIQPDNGYGPRYENAVFSIFPYYWGDCTCGFEEKQVAWSEANPHAADCYQTETAQAIGLMEARIGYRAPESFADAFNIEAEDRGGGLTSFTMTPKHDNSPGLYELRREEDNKIRRALCEKHGIPWNDGRGCAVHCTCSHERDWEAWASVNDHAKECPLVIPNFHHKPSGYQMKWYKYPLRDSYASRAVELSEFRKMIDECISSIGR